MRFNRKCGVVVLALLSGSLVRAADLSIGGDAVQPQDFSVDQLKQLPSAKTVEYTSRGQKHQATGVPLLAVLESAGLTSTIAPSPSVAPAAKHPPLRMAVSVAGSDGYAVLFSVAELLPSVGNRAALLAWAVDGQPITIEQGPLKLVVPDDAGPARAVRNVTRLEVYDHARPTTLPLKQ